MNETEPTDAGPWAPRRPSAVSPEAPVIVVRPRRLPVAVLVVLVFAVSFVGATVHLFVRPSLPPLPRHADVIFVLSGYGDRPSVAERLAREGVAPVIVRSTTAQRAADPHGCLEPIDGVQELCIHPEPYTTRGEAQAIAELARRNGWRSVILVTSRDQAWRARVRVDRCFDGTIYNAIAELPNQMWPGQLLYQWGATIKAFTTERSC